MLKKQNQTLPIGKANVCLQVCWRPAVLSAVGQHFLPVPSEEVRLSCLIALEGLTETPSMSASNALGCDEVRVLYKQFYGIFLVAQWDAEHVLSSHGCCTGRVLEPLTSKAWFPGQWIHWFEPLGLACAREKSGLLPSPQAEGASGGALQGSAGARLI